MISKVWMSTDFQQERKWKKNASKKLSIAIHKYFKEKEVKAEQQENAEESKEAGKVRNGRQIGTDSEMETLYSIATVKALQWPFCRCSPEARWESSS